MTNEVLLDASRRDRIGIDEGIFCEGKSVAQISAILSNGLEKGRSLFLTRLGEAQFEMLEEKYKAVMDYDDVSRTAFVGSTSEPTGDAKIVIVSAGTSDVPVAKEARRTLQYHGVAVDEIYDVGVAGLWRLKERIPQIARYSVVIVVAGMDAALPTVLGGLVPGVIVGVPTSVGYGASRAGETALSAMLASCAPGLAVTNIDNGFGAGCIALRALALMEGLKPFVETD